MDGNEVDRRSLLGQAAAGSVALALAQNIFRIAPALADPAPAPPQGTPFNPSNVNAEAKRLADQPYAKPSLELPEPFNKLSYDQYRDIRFKRDKAIWRGDHIDFEVQPFAMGWLYDMPVDLWLVDNGTATRLIADSRLFTFGPLIGQSPDQAPYGFSGFRVHGPINRSDYFDEYAVFQGASYLRAVGRGEGYGASSRGLAINTARPGGEEFPFFRAFWLEKPKPTSTEIVVHALLDSQSTTGAYRFAIEPGETTSIDVQATLYPRTTLTHVGIAPLTSMFLHGQSSQRPANDFRPSVHDSEGLAIVNGSGERLWRPLNNPKTLQISAFLDRDPKGFGLWQRDRSFSNFEDLEAHYERRPSVWVEPTSGWGEGFIELIEIPVDDEIHDNIVAYWKPTKDLTAGGPHSFGYKLFWGDDVPTAWTGARVQKTRVGHARQQGGVLFVIDLAGPAIKETRDLPTAAVTGSAGTIANVVVQRNPEINGVRVSFELNPAEAELVELRFVLKTGDQPISETWLYRWTKP